MDLYQFSKEVHHPIKSFYHYPGSWRPQTFDNIVEALRHIQSKSLSLTSLNIDENLSQHLLETINYSVQNVTFELVQMDYSILENVHGFGKRLRFYQVGWSDCNVILRVGDLKGWRIEGYSWSWSWAKYKTTLTWLGSVPENYFDITVMPSSFPFLEQFWSTDFTNLIHYSSFSRDR